MERNIKRPTWHGTGQGAQMKGQVREGPDLASHAKTHAKKGLEPTCLQSNTQTVQSIA